MKAFAIAAAVLLGAQDFDKDKHLWARWKVGACAKYRLTVDAAGQNQAGDFKLELTALKDKEYSTRTLISLSGNDQVEDETESFGEKKGEATIKVGEADQACTVWETAGRRGDRQTTTKLWMAAGKDVPLKLSTKVGDEEEGEYTAVALSDKIRAAGGKEFDCVRLEGNAVNQLGKMKAKLWMSSAVPGGIVKMEMQGGGDDAPFTIAIELLEFDPKK